MNLESKRNLRFDLHVALITLGVIVVVGPLLYFWNLNAKRVLSEEVLTQAQQAIDSFPNSDEAPPMEDLEQTIEKMRNSVKQLKNFLVVNPDHEEARVLLANAFDKTPEAKFNLPTNIQLHLDALAVSDADRKTLLAKVAKLLNNSGRFSEAREAAEELLLKHVATDVGEQSSAEFVAEVYDSLAIAITGEVRSTADHSIVEPLVGERFVGEIIEKAIELNPKNFLLPCYLGSIYRTPEHRQFLSLEQRERFASAPVADKAAASIADEIVAKMVSRNPGDASALLASHQYKSFFNIASAIDDLEKAAAADPDNSLASLMLGTSELKRADQLSVDGGTKSSERVALLQTAKSRFESSIMNSTQVDSRLPAARGQLAQLTQAHLKLGETFDRLGETTAAIDAWSTGLEKSNFNHQGLFERLTLALIRTEEPENLEQANSLLEKMATLSKQLARKSGADQESLFAWTQTQEFMKALVHFRKNELGDAIKLLEPLTSQQPSEQSRTRELSHQLMALIYRRLGRSADAAFYLESLDRVGGLPENVELASVGELYLDAGNYTKAVSILQRTASSSGSPDNWRLLARALYLQELTAPEEARNWSAFDVAIGKAKSLESIDPATWKTTVLENLALVYRTENPTLENLAEPLKALASIADKSPDVARQLAIIHGQIGDYETSNRLADAYAKSKPTLASLAILRSQILNKQSKFKESAKVLRAALAEANDTAETTDLTLAMTDLKLQQGQTEQAFNELGDFVKANPDQGKLLFDLVELAVRIGKIESDPAPWEASLQKFEPPNGRYSKAINAYRLLSSAQNAETTKEKTELLKRADQLCSDLNPHEKHWPLLNVLRGDIRFSLYEAANDDLTSDAKMVATLLEETKLYYQRAVELGERSTRVLMRLAFLESDGNQAQRWIALINSPQATDMVAGAKINLAMQQSNISEARRLAEISTTRSPNNPNRWVHRAFLEWNLGNFDDAEQLASHAETLLEKSDSLSAWQAMFNYRMNASSTAETLESSDRQLQKAKLLTSKIVSLTSNESQLHKEAQLLAAIGSTDAGQKFLEAEKKSPNDIKLLTSAAAYFAKRGNGFPDALDQAVRITEKLFTRDAQNTRYRFSLATLLARRGLKSDWVRIKSLLKDANENSLVDARVLAILLLQKDNVTNSERVADLKSADKLIRDQISDLKSDDQTANWILLGQINVSWAKFSASESESKERTEAARTCFENALESNPVAPQQLYQIGLFRLERNDISGAQAIARNMEKISQQSAQLSPFPLALQAQIISKTQPKNSSELVTYRIAALVEKIEAETEFSSRQKTNWYLAIAKICDQAELRGLAVKWYQKAASKTPELTLRLSNALLANGEYYQALGILTDNYQAVNVSQKPIFAASISNVLIRAKSSSSVDDATNDRLYEIAQPVLDRASSSYPKNLNVIISRANTELVALGNIAKSIELYRKAHDLAPSNGLILNNLATVLSDDPAQLGDALSSIDQAITLEGRRPQLLDTKAVILRKLGRLKESEEFLVNIVHPEADSRYWWHLAEVYMQQFQSTLKNEHAQLAKKNLDIAIENGLEKAVLTPGEKSRLLELKTDLENSSAAATFTSAKNELHEVNVSTALGTTTGKQ